MNTDIKNTLSVIAFLDILGVKKIIDQDADQSLNLVYKSYTEAIAQYKKRTNPHFSIPKINIFSDNISVSFDIEDPKYKKLICRDFDGLYFIDIFYSDKYAETLPLLELLIDDNEKRIEALEDTNLKERQKLKWLHNYFIEKYDHLKAMSINE